MKLFDSVRVNHVLGALALCAALLLPGTVSAIGPADGEGALTVLPGSAVAGNTELEFQFDFSQTRTRPANLLPGTMLRITVPAEWTAPQLTDPEGAGYIDISLGAGGGIAGFNSCENYNLGAVAQPSITDTGDGWTVNIYQHCLKNDHLIISYENVTAPVAGVYPFIAWTRATLFGGDEIDESPEITVSPVCEDGFHADGIVCVANDPPFCPEDFHVETGECVPNEGGAPDFCPEDTTYNPVTGVCEGSETAPDACGPNLTYSAELDMCVDETGVTGTCPEGPYTYNFDTCIDTSNPDNPPVPVICPEGTELNENDYQCYTPSTPVSCTVGDYDIELDQCVVPDASPSCPEHYELTPGETEEAAPMCVFVPFPPSCNPGFHLNEDATACFVDETPVCEEGTHLEGDACIPDEVGSGGGGGTSHHPWERAENNDEDEDGEVLGAETGPAGSCTPLITEYMSATNANNPKQVKALEAFLNTELTLTLADDGVFDAATTQAVMDFQLKYWQEVLAPWVPYGLPTDHTATGNVFKLTTWKINSIHCAPEVLPVPMIP